MIYKIRLYAADAGELADAELYEAAYGAVTDERRKKTDKFIFPKDKRLSLGAELLVMKGLADLGISRDNISYSYGANGKPYLNCAESVYFNISHSGEMVVCAFSPLEVGCDIEKITDIDLEIARRYFFDDEYGMIDSKKTLREKYDAFFRLWTLKESFMKATGLGMSLALDAFCIRLKESHISVSHSVNESRYFFKEYNLLEGCKCAVCSLYGAYEDKARRISFADNIF